MLKKTLLKILNDSDWKSIPSQINTVSILFTTDSKIHQLNATYRNKDKPTDVLSFSQIENMAILPHHNLLGDVIISLDTAKVQAKKYNHSINHEVLRLLIHGTLHLMGYDHENVSKAEAQKMRNLEKKLFKDYLPSLR